MKTILWLMLVLFISLLVNPVDHPAQAMSWAKIKAMYRTDPPPSQPDDPRDRPPGRAARGNAEGVIIEDAHLALTLHRILFVIF